MASRIIPGDFAVTDIQMVSTASGNTIGLKFILSELNLFESIFKNSISGNLNVSDTENLISEFPIVGHEEIIISFGNPTDPNSEDIQVKFRVYKIDPYSRRGERSSEYTIHFITPEYLENAKNRISKAYSFSKISDIVSSITENNLGVEADVEITKGNHDIIIPNWRPFDALNWLCARAQNPKSDGSNYVFYEDIDGYKFKSIETLVGEAPVQNYKWKPKNLPEGEDDFLVPNDYTIQSHFDIIRNIGTGMYSSKVLLHDIIKREYEEITFDYLDTWEDHNHITNNATILKKPEELNEIFDSYVKFIPVHDKQFSDKKSNEIKNTILPRISQIQQLNNFRINMTVPGNTKLKVGSTIDFELPSLMESGSGSTDPDKLYNGKYLIAAVRHFIDGQTHECVLDLVKDSFFKELA